MANEEVVNIIDPNNITWTEYRCPNPLPVEIKPVPVVEITTLSGKTEAVSESPTGV